MQKQTVGSVLKFLLPALAATALWGTAYPSVRLASACLAVDANNIWQQLFFAGARFVPAGLMVFAYAALTGRRLLPPRGAWPGLLLLSATQIVLYYALYYYGFAHSTSVRTAIINGASALFAIGIARLCGMERITPRRAIGCLSGFAGIVVMQLGAGADGAGGFTFLGEGLLLLAVVSDGFSKVLSKRLTRSVDPVIANAWQLFLGGLAMLTAGALGGGAFRALPVRGLAWLVWLAFISAMAFTLWIGLLKNYSVGSVCVCSFLTPVFGFIATAALLPSENVFALRNVVALVLICLGVVVVNLGGHHAEKPVCGEILP